MISFMPLSPWYQFKQARNFTKQQTFEGRTTLIDTGMAQLEFEHTEQYVTFDSYFTVFFS